MSYDSYEVIESDDSNIDDINEASEVSDVNSDIESEAVTETSEQSDDSIETEKSGSDNDYVGPTSKSIEWKIEDQQKNIEKAKENLENAIKDKGSVMTHMAILRNQEEILENYMKQYNKALEGEGKA